MCSKLLFFNKFLFSGLVGLFGVFLFFLLLNTDNGLLEARTGKSLKALLCR